MKKIIGLYGRRSSGKTTTLNLLIGLFNKNGNLDDPITIRDDQRKTIVITPGGDDGEVIKKNLEAFEKAEGVILVTATRTKGQTASYLSNYFPENSVEITWIKKHYAEIRTDLVNQAQAEDIKAVIDSIIDEWDK